jgi:hypothetical protein
MKWLHIQGIFPREAEMGRVKWYGRMEVFSMVYGKMIKDIKER